VSDDDIFSDAAIKKLAEDSKLPAGADLFLFSDFVRLADRRKRRACGAYAADQVSTESHRSALMGYWLGRTLHKPPRAQRRRVPVRGMI
jgi:hypothetical protein